MGKNNAFASKPLAVSFLFYFNWSPRITIYMSHSVRRKLPGLLSSLTHNPSSLEQWPTAKIRAERLTGGGRAPGKGLARLRAARRSRRGARRDQSRWITCSGGSSRRRHEFRLAGDGRVQLGWPGSFTGLRRCCGWKESDGGGLQSRVHVHRRGWELRRVVARCCSVVTVGRSGWEASLGLWEWRWLWSGLGRCGMGWPRWPCFGKRMWGGGAGYSGDHRRRPSRPCAKGERVRQVSAWRASQCRTPGTLACSGFLSCFVIPLSLILPRSLHKFCSLSYKLALLCGGQEILGWGWRDFVWKRGSFHCCNPRGKLCLVMSNSMVSNSNFSRAFPR